MNIQIRQPLLFIDDDLERARRIHLFLGDDFDYQWVNTYDAACQAFVDRQWSMIMLDHDLEDPKDRDGQNLADKIVFLQAEFGYFSNTNFLVHSSNTVGAGRMYKILDRPDLDLVAPIIVPFQMFAV